MAIEDRPYEALADNSDMFRRAMIAAWLSADGELVLSREDWIEANRLADGGVIVMLSGEYPVRVELGFPAGEFVWAEGGQRVGS